MEKDACAMRVSARPTPKFMWKNDFTSADSCGCRALLPSPFRGSIRIARSLLCSSPFFKPLRRFLEILSSPVPRTWPFTASVTIFEGSEDFRFLQTLRLRSSFPNCQDGAKNAGKRSDRQADRRSGPGKPESSSWPGLGQQRS